MQLSDAWKDNPCCNQKKTLVITIEPCSKGHKEILEKPQNIRVKFDSNNETVRFPRKTPRTMEIEIKIKGRDQKLFSEEKVSIPDGPEIEITSHLPDEEEEKDIEKIQEEAATSTSSIIPLLCKPCLPTCPGPALCLRPKHYFGDDCRLHDPNSIGKHIMEMHRRGLFRKRVYTPENPFYPNFVIDAISKIDELDKKRKLKPLLEPLELDEPKEVKQEKKPEPVKQDKKLEEKQKKEQEEINEEEESEIIPIKEKKVPSQKSQQSDRMKARKSGCYCPKNPFPKK